MRRPPGVVLDSLARNAPQLAKRHVVLKDDRDKQVGSGGGREPKRLYRIGPHPELIGRRVATLPRLHGRATALIHQAAQLRYVDPASGFVPGEITGEVPNGRPGGGRPIALVIDGTVAAVGRTFSLEGSSVENFEAIVPEWTFHRGASKASVFEIVTRGGGPALRPL